MKTCSECKHHIPLFLTCSHSEPFRYRCAHPEYRDIVNGGYEVCRVVRSDAKRCGNEAKGWEPLPPIIMAPEVTEKSFFSRIFG